MEEDNEKLSSFFPVVFAFRVVITGNDGIYIGDFQEVTGINAKIGTEVIKEGGENSFEYRLPTPVKYDNLILKRGLVLKSDLIIWARKAIEEFDFEPRDVNVYLLDEKGYQIAGWSFVRAYPVGLKISDLKAQENAIVIETLELSYNFFKRVEV
jgi:phage tail-like protein